MSNEQKQESQLYGKAEKVQEPLPDTSFKVQETSSEPITEQPKTSNELPTEQPVTQSEITNPQPSTDMEVHHHAHHGHEKKTWKNYFWEFFMLFLAVFCGSIAELQLEHYIEHKREKQYIVALVKDLKTDTANLSFVIKEYWVLLKLRDSVFNSFDSIDRGGNKTFMRHLGYYYSGFPDFINADATIQQLKNAGGFRLLRSKPTVDSIIAYTADVNKAFINTNLLATMLNELNNFNSSIINYSAVVKATTKAYDLDKLQEQNLSLFISQDKAEKYKLYGKLLFFTQTMKNILETNFIPLKEHATSLIAFLKKEYHLEHE
jgi:hypothetical protein